MPEIKSELETRVRKLEKKNRLLGISLIICMCISLTLVSLEFIDNDNRHKDIFRNIEVDNIYLNKTIWFKRAEGKEAGWIGRSPGFSNNDSYGFALQQKDSGFVLIRPDYFLMRDKMYRTSRMVPGEISLYRTIKDDSAFERKEISGIHLNSKNSATIKICNSDSTLELK